VLIRAAILLLVVVLATLFSTGWCRLARRRRASRATPSGGLGRLALGLGGLAAVVVALVSPLDDLAHERFPAHMVQHLLLIVVAAPALVAANGFAPLLWGLPAGLRRAVGRALRPGRPLRRALGLLVSPTCAWLLHASAMWLWHLPGPYDLALESGVVHALEHATFLGTAVLFWMPVLDPAPRLRPPLGVPGRAVYLVLAAFQASALGLLLAAWPVPLYTGYADVPGALDDQAWGGALMWAVTAAADMAAVMVTVWRAMSATASRAPGPVSDPVRVRAASRPDATPP